jgi:alcohol oxidase
MTVALLCLRSQGYVHDNSADDIYSPLELDVGYLSDPADVPPQVWAYKMGREIFGRMPCYRGEHAP